MKTTNRDIKHNGRGDSTKMISNACGDINN